MDAGLLTVVEMRCPSHNRMFGKALVGPAITEGNLVEFSCKDCRKDKGVTDVKHRFNIAGELIETMTID